MSKELYVELGELANEVQSQLVTKIRTAGMEAELLMKARDQAAEEYDVVKGQLATRTGELAKVQSSLKATDALWQSAECDLIDAHAELETCKAALAACREQNAPPEEKRIIPAGAMSWKYMGRVENYWEWLQAHGYTSVKQPSSYGNEPGYPNIITLGPTKDPDWLVVERLAQCFADPMNLGIHLWDEKPWDDKALFWANYLRENYTNKPIFHGPFPWNVLYPPDHFDYCTHIISFQNCTRQARTPWDGVYHSAQAAHYGKRMLFSVNPLDSDNPPVLANGARYMEAVHIMASRCAGMLVWSTDVLYNARAGLDPTIINIGQLDAIMDTIESIKGWQLEAEKQPPRQEVKVRFGSSAPKTTADGGLVVNERAARARCRVVAMAGYAPVATVETGACDPISWASAEYKDKVNRMGDFGRWTPEIEAWVLEHEMNVLAPQVCEWMED